MIYDRIKEICKSKKLSVSYVEKEAGLAPGALCRWNKSSPTVAHLQAVAKVLKVKIEKLLE